MQQAGHWLKFAQDVSRRDNHTLDQDVKMYFYNQVVAMDAFIASWDSKMFYDYARPYALVHEYYDEQKIKAWGGVGKGMVENGRKTMASLLARNVFCVHRFQATFQVIVTISGGCAEALKIWTGSDKFGSKSVLVAGAMTEPNNLGRYHNIRISNFYRNIRNGWYFESFRRLSHSSG